MQSGQTRRRPSMTGSGRRSRSGGRPRLTQFSLKRSLGHTHHPLAKRSGRSATMSATTPRSIQRFQTAKTLDHRASSTPRGSPSCRGPGSSMDRTGDGRAEGTGGPRGASIVARDEAVRPRHPDAAPRPWCVYRGACQRIGSNTSPSIGRSARVRRARAAMSSGSAAHQGALHPSPSQCLRTSSFISRLAV